MQKVNLIGEIISGKYKVLEKVGVGGMATVYKAEQINLEKIVALKIIHPNLVYDKESVFRFQREAKDLAKLNHDNIVAVYDFGSDDHYHYICMEYLDGRSLSDIIKERNPLSVNEAFAYIEPIIDALAYLHEKALVHRDISSFNIFITKSGRPVLMDFGVAFHKDKTITDSNSIFGNPPYMSPEQAEGKEIDARSDIYSIGIVIYECLTGKVPFKTDNPTSTLFKVVHEQPVPPIQLVPVPESIDSLILALLKKDRNERIESASKLNSILKNETEYIVPEAAENKNELNENVKEVVTIDQEGDDKTVKITVDTEPGPEPKPKSKKKKTRNLLLGFLVIILAFALVYYFIIKDNIKADKLTEQADLLFNQKKFTKANKLYSQIYSLDPEYAGISDKMKQCGQQIGKQILKEYLVKIKGGSFTMGSSEGRPDELPVRTVSLADYYLGKHEISNAQFCIFLNAHQCNAKGEYDSRRLILLSNRYNKIRFNGLGFHPLSGGENLPVSGVTWYGANMFCKWLGGRLPTEAEWEYAALGKINNKYSGSNILNEVAWFEDNSSSNLRRIASKKPNAYGLYDMSGNAWEWCYDYYQRSYKGLSANNPKGPTTGNSKVIRGGSCIDKDHLLRVKSRFDEGLSGSRFQAIGFRMCIPK